MPQKKRTEKPVAPSSDENVVSDQGDVTGGSTPVTSEAPAVVVTQGTSTTTTHESDDTVDEPITGAPLKQPEQRRNIALERIKRFAETMTVEPLTSQSESLLKTKLALVSDEWLKFMAAHDEISLKAVTWAGEQENLELYDQAARVYANCINIITNNITKVKANSKLVDQSQNLGTHGLLANSLNLKLEPIRIPIFNGAKENWVLFRDQFISLVHEND